MTQSISVSPRTIKHLLSQIYSEQSGKIFANRTAMWKRFSVKSAVRGIPEGEMAITELTTDSSAGV